MCVYDKIKIQIEEENFLFTFSFFIPFFRLIFQFKWKTLQTQNIWTLLLHSLWHCFHRSAKYIYTPNISRCKTNSKGNWSFFVWNFFSIHTTQNKPAPQLETIYIYLLHTTPDLCIRQETRSFVKVLLPRVIETLMKIQPSRKKRHKKLLFSLCTGVVHRPCISNSIFT